MTWNLRGLVFLMVVLVNTASALAANWTRDAHGVALAFGMHVERVTVYSPQIIRVTYQNLAAHQLTKEPQSLSVIAKPGRTPFTLRLLKNQLILSTSACQARIDLTTGAVRFCNRLGRPLLSELPGKRSLQPKTAANQAEYSSQDAFALQKAEGIYGLGQHQDGYMNYRGSTVTLEQHNMEVAIPFLVSSLGYGLLWDNPAYTTVSVDGPNPRSLIPASAFRTASGTPGLDGEYYGGRTFEGPVLKRTDATVDFMWTGRPPLTMGPENYCVRWTGTLIAPTPGRYTLETSADDGVRLFVDGRQIIDDWTAHPTKADDANIVLSAGPHKIRLEYFQAGGGAEVHLLWATPQPPHAPAVVWKSEVADAVDYYFIDGPTLREVIPAYRWLTGAAPMPGKWALGYWQSKERYNTQQEWLDIATEYRKRREPIDNLVQDWFYWDPGVWGSHYFDPKRYPDPAAALDIMHNSLNMHVMISVWGRFDTAKPDDPTGDNYRDMMSHGYLYPNLGGYYDAFNPDARKLYWEQMWREIFEKGFDAWWLDASEPEVDMQAFRKVQPLVSRTNALSPGRKLQVGSHSKT